MRKIIVLEHISLDGVIQAASGPDEDSSDGFAYGGWAAPYSDATLGTELRKMMNMPFDLLVGRKTFDIWARYWPQHADFWPGVNTATKYVASNTMTSSEWQPSVLVRESCQAVPPNGPKARNLIRMRTPAPWRRKTVTAHRRSDQRGGPESRRCSLITQWEPCGRLTS